MTPLDNNNPVNNHADSNGVAVKPAAPSATPLLFRTPSNRGVWCCFLLPLALLHQKWAAPGRVLVEDFTWV